MLRPESTVNIVDNSGPRTAKIFYIRGDLNKNVKSLFGTVRDRVRMSVRTMRKFKARRRGGRKRKTIYISMKRWGYIVRTRAWLRYRSYMQLHFIENACVIY